MHIQALSCTFTSISTVWEGGRRGACQRQTSFAYVLLSREEGYQHSFHISKLCLTSKLLPETPVRIETSLL